MSQSLASFTADRLPSELTSHITGNVPIEIKELPVKWLAVFRNDAQGFAGPVSLHMRVTDVSAHPSPDHAKRLQGKVTVEIDVTPCMCSSSPTLLHYAHWKISDVQSEWCS